MTKIKKGQKGHCVSQIIGGELRERVEVVEVGKKYLTLSNGAKVSKDTLKGDKCHFVVEGWQQ